jgi:spoIIIJ-associated protein
MEQTASPEEITSLRNLVVDLLGAMGFEADVQAEETVIKGLVFNIGIGKDSYLLIGHRGGTLHALEILMQALAVRRFPGRFIRFSLDVDDYRRKREWYIKETVHGALEQLKRTGRSVALAPMPNYERRLVHALVSASGEQVASVSSGFDPNRRVIIRLK